jgi:hypothetical protein
MPTVKQFGFSTRSGSLANIVDGDVSTGWAPLADGLPTYTDPFLVGGLLNTAGRFAAIEFDYGVPVRMSAFLFQVETRQTLGASVLVGSENPATSTSDTVQSGDQLLGTFSAEQMTSGHVNIVTPARVDDSHDARVYAHRYYRFLQRTSNPASPGGLPSDPTPTLGSNFAIYDQFSGNFTTPTYSVLTIELWGAAASGGLSADANPGGDTTCTTYSLTAHGGGKSSATSPNLPSTATGGAATGGNTENTAGQNGGSPFPSDGTTTVGHSGKGGDSPHGGLGGPEVYNDYNGQRLGIDGTAPGGGGSGLNTLVPSGDGNFYKYPGGAGGGYVKHVLTFGAGGPNPGDTIAWAVGVGGLSNSKKNGNGANGRVKFSWT